MNVETATMSDPRENPASDVSDCTVMPSVEVMTLLELTLTAPDAVADRGDVGGGSILDAAADVRGDAVADRGDVGGGSILDAAADVRGDGVVPAEDADRDDTDQTVGTSFARCADGNGTLTHLFFSDDEFDIARAKAICGKCGLAGTCLAGALDRVEPYGVWGGQLLIDGVVVAVKRGRGRPPKHPRPPLVVDEVPLPPHLVA